MGPIKARIQGKIRPYRFRFEENGELYCIGSEVGNHLKVFRGHLYKKYPGLTRRTVTQEERKRLVDLGLGKYSTVSQVTLLKASEVDEIIDGNEDQYKGNKARSGSIVQANCNVVIAPHGTDSNRPSKSQSGKEVKPRQSAQHFASTGLSYSIHLDPVPQATQVVRGRDKRKKGRIFPLCIDDLDPRAVDDNALKPEELVPIRLELDVDGQKLRDTFTWNRNETLISPEEFAESLCYDLGLNHITFTLPIATSIRNQIEAAPSADEIPTDSQCVTLKLNIQIGNVSVVDNIQWDITEKANSPEKFAVKLCQELGLSGEFVTAISYSIRGQLFWHLKTGGGLPCENISNPPFRNPSVVDQWSPFIETLTEAELEKKLRDADRHIRRVRRVAI